MLLTVGETAAMLNITPGGIYYLLYICRLDGVRIRGCWRVFSESVEDYLAERKVRSGDEKQPSLYPELSGGNGVSPGIGENGLPADPGRVTLLEGRRRGLEFSEGRPPVLPGKPVKRKKLVQLYFDFY